MTDPTRPTDAELEAGHARLTGFDPDFTIAPMPTSEETYRAQVLGRTVRKQTPLEAPEYIDIESVKNKVVLRPYQAPYTMTAEEVEAARHALTADEAADLRARFLGRYPELAAFYEGIRSKIKEPAWTARQKPSTRSMTIEEVRASHRASEAASGCAGITPEDKEPTT